MRGFRRHSGWIRRLLTATGAVCIFAAVGAAPAFAALGLAGASDTLPPVASAESVTQTFSQPVVSLTEATEPVAPQSELAASGPTLPAVEAPRQEATVAEAVQQPAAPAGEVVQRMAAAAEPTNRAMPVVSTAQQTTALAGQLVLDIPAQAAHGLDEVATSVAEPVTAATEAVALLVNTTAPMLEATRAGVISTGPSLEDAQPVARVPQVVEIAQVVTGAPPLGDDELPASATATTHTESAFDSRVSDASRAQRRDAGASAPRLPILPSGPVDDVGRASPGSRGTSAVRPSNSPMPTAPGGPPGALGSAFTSAAAGALVIFLAALAAALLLAAPGLGRRLRPTLAPWPLSNPQLSLERPG